RHVGHRAREGIDCNINRLGEAILGDDEADARLDAVCRLLRRADVQCVSVKISALCANLDVLAFDHSLARVVERVRRLLRLAAGARRPKVGYLAREEHRALQRTVAAFRAAPAAPEFSKLTAGTALQSFLPDSYTVLGELCDWAATRAAPVRVRIVKGANL